MAEHGGNYRDRQAVRDQETRGRMAHVIEAKRLRQPSGGEVALVFLRQVARIERCSDCRGKDEAGFLPVRDLARLCSNSCRSLWATRAAN